MEFVNKEYLLLLLLLIPYVLWYLLYRKKSEPTMQMSDTFAYRYAPKSLRQRLVWLPALLRMITFVLVDFSWIFFRAQSMNDAFHIIGSIFGADNPWIIPDGSLYECGLDVRNFRLLAVCIAVLLFADLMKRRGVKVREVILEQDGWFRWIFIAVSVCFVLLFGKYGKRLDSAAFIYFQF